jgi:hypothetical protein
VRLLVDLDTVMPGLYLYDFGDSIRSGASTAPEMRRILDRVSMDIELFSGSPRGISNPREASFQSRKMELLPFAAKLMTLECGMRFLTDHLNGDTYFRTHRPGTTWTGPTQFSMVADMEDKMEYQ